MLLNEYRLKFQFRSYIKMSKQREIWVLFTREGPHTAHAQNRADKLQRVKIPLIIAMMTSLYNFHNFAV